MKLIPSCGMLPLCLIYYSAFSQGIPLAPNKSFPSSSDTSASLAAATPSPGNISGNGISDRALHALDNQYGSLDRTVASRTEKMLTQMESRELALQKKLQGQDSAKAAALFAGTRAKYQQLLDKLHGTAGSTGAYPLKEYLPRVDSMQTALRYLGQPASSLLHQPSLPAGQLQNVAAVSTQLEQLQGRLQIANEVKSFVRKREQQLKDQLSNYNVSKLLLGVNKEVFYYQAELANYKRMLNDPGKWQQAVLSAVRQSPLFPRFWQQNSYLSRLFPAPENPGTPQELAGLQTRDKLQQELQQKFGLTQSAISSRAGSSGGGGAGYLQQQVQNAQTQVNAIEQNIKASGAGSSNMTMPDFQPNNQHHQSLLKRLECSFSIQNNSSTNLLPAISTLGINIGYKISDKATAGIGGNYLLGLGNGFNHIRLSNQGVGGKAFLDIKTKGSIWVTGGFEYNYMQQFSSMQDLKNLDYWQKSALIGLTKKYRIGKRTNNIQLLYDLLAGTELPRGRPIVFRIGWGL